MVKDSKNDEMNKMLAKQRDVINKLMKLGGPKRVIFNEVIWNLIYIALYILYSLYCAMGLCFFIAGAFIEYGVDYIKEEIIPEYARKEPNVWSQEAYYKNSVKTISVISGYIGYYIMSFGGICILVGVIGIVGLAKHVNCFMLFGAVSNLLFLIFWFTISLILSLGEFGISEILAYFFKKAVLSGYKFDNENKSKNGFTLAWDEIQSSLKCCGAVVFTEYQGISNQIGNYTVPSSCCRNTSNKDCWINPTENNSYIETPCKIAIWKVLDPYIELLKVISDYIEMLVISLFWLSWVCIMKLVLTWRYKIRCLNETMKKA